EKGGRGGGGVFEGFDERAEMARTGPARAGAGRATGARHGILPFTGRAPRHPDREPRLKRNGYPGRFRERGLYRGDGGASSRVTAGGGTSWVLDSVGGRGGQGYGGGEGRVACTRGEPRTVGGPRGECRSPLTHSDHSATYCR